jgi:hypothetical protein
VFDAAMLVALPQFGREQLVATLVLFRILYFMLPFAVAIAVMASRELWINVMRPWQQRRAQEQQDLLRAAGAEQHRAATATVIPHPAKNRQARG